MSLDFIGGLIVGLACALSGLLLGCVLALWLLRNEDKGHGGGDWDIEELDPDPEPSVHA
jgi:hypothetical protein